MIDFFHTAHPLGIDRRNTNFIVKKNGFLGGARLSDIDFFFFVSVYIYIRLQKKKNDMLAFCEKQRDLRKFRCPWFEISLPVV